jgi:hypothetical protein
VEELKAFLDRIKYVNCTTTYTTTISTTMLYIYYHYQYYYQKVLTLPPIIVYRKLQEGPDSAINMEYLKNCVYKYMASNELSEKKRLYPVICTILKLTSQERKVGRFPITYLLKYITISTISLPILLLQQQQQQQQQQL